MWIAWLGDVVLVGPELLQLITVEGLEPVDEDRLGDGEFFGQLRHGACPGRLFGQLLESHEQSGGFEADAPFNGWRLAASVPIMDVDQFMRERAAMLILGELGIQPNAASPVSGSGRVRMWARPDDCNVRELAQPSPWLEHKPNIYSKCLVKLILRGVDQAVGGAP